MKKPETLARRYLQYLADQNLPFAIVDFEGCPDLMPLADPKAMTEAQGDAIYLTVLYATAYPRIYQKAIAIAANEGLAVKQEAA